MFTCWCVHTDSNQWEQIIICIKPDYFSIWIHHRWVLTFDSGSTLLLPHCHCYSHVKQMLLMMIDLYKENENHFNRTISSSYVTNFVPLNWLYIGTLRLHCVLVNQAVCYMWFLTMCLTSPFYASEIFSWGLDNCAYSQYYYALTRLLEFFITI